MVLYGGAIAAAALATNTLSGCVGPAQRSIDLQTHWAWSRQAVPFSLGITHTEKSIDPNDPGSAREPAERVLAATGSMYQNQHLMGFGTLNPQPAPCIRDWVTLDQRMSLIERTNGTTVLTLAVAPDWMKGGLPGETDWSKIEVAPLPEHFEAFAALATDAVLRYPQVTHVQVWNELKGFFDEARNDWDRESYTRLYNIVYDAVKAVRPDILIGGPYMTIAIYENPEALGFPSAVRGLWGVVDQRALDTIDYWLANARGADFLVIDGSAGTQDSGLLVPPVRAAEFFAAVTDWVRARTTLPIWWSEFYIPAEGSASPESAESAATAIAAVAEMARSGVSTALLWHPQSRQDFPFPALWTSTENPDGGLPTALTEPWTWLHRELSGGNTWIGHTRDRCVLGFRGSAEALLLNTSGDIITLAGRPEPTVLAPWQSVIIPHSSVVPQ